MNTSHDIPGVDCPKPLDGFWILVVDDSTDQLRLYQHWLERAGAQVATEKDGKEAIDAVASFPRIFDLILMDYKMPVMDGLQATRELRSNGYPGAIVGISAHDTPEIRTQWEQAGSDGFLAKPFAIETLFQYICLTVRRVQAKSVALSQ